MKLGGDFVHVRRDHVGGLFRSGAGEIVPALDNLTDFLDLLAMDGGGAGDNFEPVKILRIVTARNHDGAIRLEMKGRVVQDRSRDDADIGHDTAARLQPGHERVPQPVRTQAAVAAEVDVLAVVPLQIRADGAP